VCPEALSGLVIPAKAGIQLSLKKRLKDWAPAFAGVTHCDMFSLLPLFRVSLSCKTMLLILKQKDNHSHHVRHQGLFKNGCIQGVRSYEE
jgi:hypothetical protein